MIDRSIVDQIVILCFINIRVFVSETFGYRVFVNNTSLNKSELILAEIAESCLALELRNCNRPIVLFTRVMFTS